MLAHTNVPPFTGKLMVVFSWPTELGQISRHSLTDRRLPSVAGALIERLFWN